MPSNLDTRELQARLDELLAMREAHEEDPETEPELDAEEERELEELQTLSEEVSEWSYGETLIHESNFQSYAIDCAEDIHGRDAFVGWPMNCIDWEQAAEALQSDYTAYEYEGETYYARA